MIPRIILDENIYSSKLSLALRKMGYRIIKVRRGLPDHRIAEFMYHNQDTVLITKDKALESQFGYNRSLIVFDGDSMNEQIKVISSFMAQFGANS